MSGHPESRRVGALVADRFRLRERLADGGMGEVWRALDTHDGGEVALKLLRAELREDPLLRQRLATEARNIAMLDHPSIAAFVANGRTGETDYLALRFVPGVALSTLIGPGAGHGELTFTRAARILGHTARALAHAHERGIVHRDVKPANILVGTNPDGTDTVTVTDFGISLGDDAPNLTATGRVMGTADYLAPERARGAATSASTDMYALGVTAFEVFAGYRPYSGPNPIAVAMRHVSDPIPPLPARVPAPLSDLVYDLLAKEPEERPESAHHVAERFFTFCVPDSLSTPPAPAALASGAASSKEEPW
ncbi:MAG: serine/threonine-protein kinase [Bowdeniella nasicola]|nr:serine/threonine-protein kinase [Bowdeniella nasicola]